MAFSHWHLFSLWECNSAAKRPRDEYDSSVERQQMHLIGRTINKQNLKIGQLKVSNLPGLMAVIK
ncbi:hypothetical protein NECAME_01405 [Necator americanus]|uniref:Uncharacterized protein n=1 Tax=Necator americanus TaxID=51031 RepID=W2TTV9_NECAM|nr:hypothetical protein NECAME_01405 [Necator americanus]ETN85515.1 hypothetical protein NECAME_01405 [Necator americanus]